ncbi:protein kinase [candidate division KSB1 bacterium]|nr:protein kinase [candidate division KSB1 bacterium]
MTAMIGKTILRYKILEKLGEGGMGIVYLADDTKLERKVAIKFLPHHIAGNLIERERFKVEAKAAAALNDPNIATIYTIEESNDGTFIVMELVEGKDLNEIIRAHRDTPLTIDSILDIAIQIAEGLRAAHEKGIVHRDVKSGNIRITDDNKIKIMDFGLATVGAGQQSTKDYSTHGTTAYMAPEQARGEPADHRSDIWAFGIVLYELLTGTVPFTGDYSQAILYSILNEEPVAISEIRRDAPEQLSVIVNKILHKEPENRYQNMAELHADLKLLKQGIVTGQLLPDAHKNIWSNKITLAISAIVILFVSLFLIPRIKISLTETQSVPSIAVLYLKNLGAADDDPFSYGITQDLIIDLSKIGDVRVAPMKDVLSVQDAGLSVKTISEQLRVRYIFDASLRREGDGFKLSGQLVDASSGKTLWADRLLAQASEIAQLQGRIAHIIINTLDLKPSSALASNLGRAITTDPDAYEYYLRGKYIYEKRTSKNETIIARGLFEKAIDLDSTFSAARIALGLSYEHAAEYDLAEQAYASALTYAKRGGDKYGEASALIGLGALHSLQADYRGALEYYLPSMEISRENGDRNGLAWALNSTGIVYDYLGRSDDALENYTKSLAIFRELGDRKQESKLLNNLGSVYVGKGQYTKALDYFGQRIAISTELNEPHPIAYGLFNSGGCYFVLGEYSKALDHYQRALKIFRDIGDRMMECYATGSIGDLYLSVGDTLNARKNLLSSLEMGQVLNDAEVVCDVAPGLGLLDEQQGKREKAFARYEQSLNISRDTGYLEAEASALELMGNYFFDEGNYQSTYKSLTAADSIYILSGQYHHRIRTLSLLALNENGKKSSTRMNQYLGETEKLLLSVEQSVDFIDVYWRLSRAYELLNNETKQYQYLDKAHALLAEYVNNIHEPDMRTMFLTNVAFNRDIMAAWKNRTGN